MAKADYIGLGGDKLLAKAFAGWTFFGFTFPNEGIKDGCTGEKCISSAVPYYLRRRAANGSWQVSPDDAIGLISAHLYFKASCGEMKESTRTFNVALKELHLTMRRTKSQLLIDGSGPSILTSEESIHINRNTPWGRTDNIDKLVSKLANEISGAPAFTRTELLSFLTEYRNLTTDRLRMLSEELLVDVKAHLEKQLGVPVSVDGDVSLTGR